MTADRVPACFQSSQDSEGMNEQGPLSRCSTVGLIALMRPWNVVHTRIHMHTNTHVLESTPTHTRAPHTHTATHTRTPCWLHAGGPHNASVSLRPGWSGDAAWVRQQGGPVRIAICKGMCSSVIVLPYSFYRGLVSAQSRVCRRGAALGNTSAESLCPEVVCQLPFHNLHPLICKAVQLPARPAQAVPCA